MSEDIIGSISAEDFKLLQTLKELTKHNGLTEYGDDYLPPRYTDPSYITPYSGDRLFIANLVFLAITCLVVAGRYYARVFIAGGLGGDDIAIGVSTVLFIGTVSMYSYAVKAAGFGQHIFDLNMNHIEKLLKITYAMPIIYNISVFMIKLSLLLFYRRLFGKDRTLQGLVKILMVFQGVYTLGSCLGLVFMCEPVQSWWSLELRAHHCPDFSKTMLIYVSLRSISVFTDIIVLCLPMKMLWGLEIPARHKAGLAVIFGLGIMACVTAIVRLAYLPRLLLNIDVSWNVIPIAMLEVFEQSLGIITASLPALTAIIAKFRGSINVDKKELGSDAASFKIPRIEDGNTQKRKTEGVNNPGFDFLSLAYDPDNTIHTRAWGPGAPERSPSKLGRIRDYIWLKGAPRLFRSTSGESLVGFYVEPLRISKTTTVEVSIG